MKHCLHFLLAAAFGLFFTAKAFAAAGDVALYLAPDASTLAFLRVPAGDARLAAAQPAANGWQTVSLPGPFTAYVQSNHVHKDLTVIAGTPIHAAANSNSPVLGTAPDNPPLSLLSPDIDWSTVSYAGPVTVYFQKAAPAAMPAAPTPVTAAPAPVAVVSPKPVAVTAQPVATVVTATPTATAAATDVPHYYYGVLQLRTNPALGGPINAQYLLYSEKGALVALVDLSNVVLGRSVAEYLGKSVKVYGTAYTVSNLPSIVINAQMVETTN
jgi:hypothetical protein